jgi:4-amino-4-deoxy-L-arabinose transferase-like glycosyltransferase
MDDRFWRILQNFGGRRRADAGAVADFSDTPPVFGAQKAAECPVAVPARTLDRTAGDYDRLRPEQVSRVWVTSLGVLFFVYLITCGVPRLFDQIDGQYAGAAREMIVRNDWLIPTQDGVPRLQKPPLVYWCEILSMRALGITEFAARLPVALATVGWFVGTGLIARRAVGSWSGGLAGAVSIAMFTGTFFFAHLVMPEPFLCCFLALTFWSFLMALEADALPEQKQSANHWLIAAWLFIALGTLAKGIHAVLIPVTAFSFAALLRPSVRPLWRRFLLRPHGWILFFVLVAPWYLMVEARYPGFIRDQFFNEQIGSALSRRWPADSDRVPLPIFWGEQLGLLFPITLLLPAAIIVTLGRRKEFRPWITDAGVILSAWFLVVALGISFSNIQDYYLMIAWAPVAVWIGWAVTKHTISFKWPAIIVALLGVAGLAAAVGLVISRGNASVDSSGPSALIDDTILNVFQILPPPIWKEIIPLLCFASGFAVVTGIVVFLLDRKSKSDLCFAALAILMAAFFTAGTRGMQLVEDQFSSAKIGQAIASRSSPESMVIAQGNPNEKTTLFFYLLQPIFWVDGDPNIEFATRSLGIGRANYLTRDQVAAAWKERRQVFLIVERTEAADWGRNLGLTAEQSNPIAGCGSRVILANR